MEINRRSVLKSLGVASGASVLTTGSALADRECVETLATRTITEITNVAIAGFYFETPTFNFEENIFESSDLPANRIKTTITWGPTNEGNQSLDIYLQQNTSGWETIGSEQEERASVTVPTPLFDLTVFPPLGSTTPKENRLEFIVQNDDYYEGPDPRDETSPSKTNIRGGIPYRFYLLITNKGVATTFEIEVEAQAFDPDCLWRAA